MEESSKTIAVMEKQVATLWASQFSKSNSPLVLNDSGKAILQSSGIDAVVDGHYGYLLGYVKNRAPKNAFEAQELVKAAVSELSLDDEMKNDLEMRAFKSGVDVLALSFIGAL